MDILQQDLSHKRLTESQILKGLEQKTLDARAKHPKLTSKGQAIVTHALPAVENKMQSFFNTRTKKELQQLIQLFQKLKNIS